MELPNAGRKELAKQWSDWDNRVDCRSEKRVEVQRYCEHRWYATISPRIILKIEKVTNG
jgi:hypothetical protein